MGITVGSEPPNKPVHEIAGTRGADDRSFSYILIVLFVLAQADIEDAVKGDL